MSLHVFEGPMPALSDIAPLTHGPTGSRVVKGKVQVDRNVQTHHYLEPGPPSRRTSSRDENDIEHERVLTDEEFAKAKAVYEQRHAEWARTCGTFQTAGVTTVLMHGQCEDWTTFVAMYDGARAQWRFVSYETPAPIRWLNADVERMVTG